MAKELLLGKYEVDGLGRLFVETGHRRWYPVDFSDGKMVVLTDSLLWDRAKRRGFQPSEFPVRLPSGRPHIDRGRLPGQPI